MYQTTVLTLGTTATVTGPKKLTLFLQILDLLYLLAWKIAQVKNKVCRLLDFRLFISPGYPARLPSLITHRLFQLSGFSLVTYNG